MQNLAGETIFFSYEPILQVYLCYVLIRSVILAYGHWLQNKKKYGALTVNYNYY